MFVVICGKCLLIESRMNLFKIPASTCFSLTAFSHLTCVSNVNFSLKFLMKNSVVSFYFLPETDDSDESEGRRGGRGGSGGDRPDADRCHRWRHGSEVQTRWKQHQRLSVYLKCCQPNFALFSVSLLSQVRELYRKREEEVRKEAWQSGHRRWRRQPKHRRCKEGLPEASGLRPDGLHCIFNVKRLFFTSTAVCSVFYVWLDVIHPVFVFFLKRCIFMMLWALHNVCRMRRPSLKHTSLDSGASCLWRGETALQGTLWHSRIQDVEAGSCVICAIKNASWCQNFSSCFVRQHSVEAVDGAAFWARCLVFVELKS